MEGRYAHAVGYRSTSARDTLQSLAKQLATVEAALAPGTIGGFQGKVEALLAASRLRAGTGMGRPFAEVEGSIDPASLHGAFSVLSEYAEALTKMQGVLRRSQRDVAVFEDLLGREMAF